MFLVSSEKNIDLKFFQAIKEYKKAHRCNMVLVGNTATGGRVEMPKNKTKQNTIFRETTVLCILYEVYTRICTGISRCAAMCLWFSWDNPVSRMF